MNREYSIETAYYNQAGPIENNLTMNNTNYAANPFGNYQSNCDYENTSVTDVHRMTQGYTVNEVNVSNMAYQSQQLTEETISNCSHIVESLPYERNFLTRPVGKHGFDGRPITHHKRSRTVFQPHQIRRLQYEFERETYMVGMKRRNLSKELDLSEKQIKIWFQNRRMKQKRERNRKHRGLESFQNVFANHGNYFEKFGLENAVKMAAQQRIVHNHQLLML